jgi:hypothetical protein
LIELTLNKKDIKDCRNLAKLRDAKKVRFGAGRHGNLTSSSEESHFLGLLGEKALSNAFYLDLDRSINDDGGDDGHDFIILGRRADIKTCSHPAAWTEPELKVPCGKKKDLEKIEGADIFVLCSIKKNQEEYLVRLWGWAETSDVKNAKKKKYRYNGPLNHVMTRTEMKNFSELGLTSS